MATTIKPQSDRYIGVRIPKALHAAAHKRAKWTGRGFSQFIRDAIASACAVGEPPTQKGK